MLSTSRRATPNRPLLIWAGVLFIVGLTGFFVLWGMVAENSGLTVYDKPLLEWLQTIRVHWATQLLGIITTAANPLWFTVIVIVLAGLWALLRREIWRPVLLALAMGVVALTSTFVKLAIARPRPPAKDMLFGISTSYSFPSGHALAAGVFFIVLAYLLISRNAKVGRRAMWVAVAVVGIFAISFSRLYLGHHWLTDVLAGLSLSLAIASLVLVADAFRPEPVGARIQKSSRPVVGSKVAPASDSDTTDQR